jgi:hypothetical protein
LRANIGELSGPRRDSHQALHESPVILLTVLTCSSSWGGVPEEKTLASAKARLGVIPLGVLAAERLYVRLTATESLH